MARYLESELYAVLQEMECSFDGEETDTGQVWYTRGGHVFTILKPVGGWFDADVIDLILSDRWLPKPIGRLKRYDEDRPTGTPVP